MKRGGRCAAVSYENHVQQLSIVRQGHAHDKCGEYQSSIAGG